MLPAWPGGGKTWNLRFLPTLPLTLSYPLLFGTLLVAGMLGGEVARRLRLPRIIGYVLVGFAIAPVAAAMNLGPLLDEARIFVDIALGLVLFDLGRRLDIGWLKRDWTLTASAIGESALTFGIVFATLVQLRVRRRCRRGWPRPSRWPPRPRWCCWWRRTRAPRDR